MFEKIQVGSRSDYTTTHHTPKRFFLILPRKQKIVSVIYHRLLWIMWVVTKLKSHFTRFLDTIREHINPVIFILTQTIISVTQRINFLSILTKSSITNSHPFWTILEASLCNCTGIPNSVKCIYNWTYFKIHPPIIIWCMST